MPFGATLSFILFRIGDETMGHKEELRKARRGAFRKAWNRRVIGQHITDKGIDEFLDAINEAA